jgi:hypothetical protein
MSLLLLKAIPTSQLIKAESGEVTDRVTMARVVGVVYVIRMYGASDRVLSCNIL